MTDPFVDPTVTTGPIAGSTKVYTELDNGARVPFRRVALAGHGHLDLYDTSGPLHRCAGTPGQPQPSRVRADGHR
jgi:phosphomethylpyrimidine synthase